MYINMDAYTYTCVHMHIDMYDSMYCNTAA